MRNKPRASLEIIRFLAATVAYYSSDSINSSLSVCGNCSLLIMEPHTRRLPATGGANPCIPYSTLTELVRFQCFYAHIFGSGSSGRTACAMERDPFHDGPHVWICELQPGIGPPTVICR